MNGEIEWPREIWMAERDDHDQGIVSAVLSERATVARFDGDTERERDFHRYVDADIYETAERYWHARVAAAYEAAAELARKCWHDPESEFSDAYVPDAIHALTTADAKAAMEAVRRDARAEAIQKATMVKPILDQCEGWCEAETSHSGVGAFKDCAACQITNAILALIDKPTQEKSDA